MHLWSTLLFFIASISAHAQQACPRLEGTFHCRTNPAFDITAQNEHRDGIPVYTFTDPTGVRDIIVDGAAHELRLQDKVGWYTAHCGTRDLLVDVHGPKGEVFQDRYYIDRAALVQVRAPVPLRRGDQAKALSCAPTHGTWELYPR